MAIVILKEVGFIVLPYTDFIITSRFAVIEIAHCVFIVNICGVSNYYNGYQLNSANQTTISVYPSTS